MPVPSLEFGLFHEENDQEQDVLSVLDSAPARCFIGLRGPSGPPWKEPKQRSAAARLTNLSYIVSNRGRQVYCWADWGVCGITTENRLLSKVRLTILKGLTT